ncbi:hypothetical protein [Sphingobium nicotianae]|uniref:Uncharacterized protein n=1 Tax=Sphingobium nicotianae TaxID=2782607 RepID=A0A9X1ISR4_9SPHN|nr:hypothetical protein [Sphingobium nicotianae]MBT2188866.1 hypothetical protein [Sphingobium nicotianae]
MSSQLGLLIPIAAITVGPIAWVANNWIRARHGYPIETKKGQLVGRDGDLHDSRKIELLSNENGALKDKIGRLEERIAVLERIATDPAERTAREIEQLR